MTRAAPYIEGNESPDAACRCSPWAYPRLTEGMSGLAERGMTLTRLSELVGVSIVNLSILKNDRARAIRYSTLSAICRALDCEIGDLLVRAD